VKKGQKVRIRLANLSMNSHPIHLHGYEFTVVSQGAKRMKPSAQYDAVTINVPVGSTETIEFVANEPGDWALHCHKTHHTMNGMDHAIPNEMMNHNMAGPPNYLKMGSPGQFGVIELSGMFTVLKVREGITTYENPGWYQNPPGTVAEPYKQN